MSKYRRTHRDDRRFLPSSLADQRMKAHRTFRLSDPAILALLVIVLAIVGGLARAWWG